MNLTEVIRAVIDRHICTRQASEDNKRLLTEAIVKAIPKREHGKWINHYDDLFPAESTIECSVCHEEQFCGIDTNFCPNCGADMRGDEKE